MEARRIAEPGVRAASDVKQEGMSLRPSSFSLCGRSITGWAQSIMLAGVVVSVVGVASAVFSSAVFAGVGYGLLGVVSVLGVAVSQSAMDSEQVQNSIAELGEQNAFLDQQVKKLEEAETLSQGQMQEFKAKAKVLLAQIKVLETENAKIVEAQKAMQATVASAAASNHALEESKRALERRMAELQNQLRAAKDTLGQMVAAQGEIAKKVEEFSLAVSSITRSKEDLHITTEKISLLTSQNTSILGPLGAYIASFSKELLSYIQHERQEHTKVMEEYKREVGRLHGSVARLSAQNTVLSHIATKLQEKEDALGLLADTLAREKEEIKALYAALDEERRGISSGGDRIRAEVAELQTIKEELITQLVALEKALSAKLTRMEALKRRKIAQRVRSLKVKHEVDPTATDPAPPSGRGAGAAAHPGYPLHRAVTS